MAHQLGNDLGQQPMRRTGRPKNQSTGYNLDTNIFVPVFLDVTTEVWYQLYQIRQQG